MRWWTPVLALVLLTATAQAVDAFSLQDPVEAASFVAAPATVGGSGGGAVVESRSAAGPVQVETRARLALFVSPVGSARGPVDGSPPVAIPGAVAALFESLLVGLALAYFARAKAWILSAGPLALFTRIEKGRVLDNATRQRIHDAVEREPGLTVTQIVDVCGVGWGTAVFHLRRLESHGLLSSEAHRRRRRYFPAGRGIANATKSAYCELLDPTSQRIAAQVLERPGSAQKDVCAALGLKASHACKHLSALARASLVEPQRQANRVHYFPTPHLADLLRLLDAPGTCTVT